MKNVLLHLPYIEKSGSDKNIKIEVFNNKLGPFANA